MKSLLIIVNMAKQLEKVLFIKNRIYLPVLTNYFPYLILYDGIYNTGGFTFTYWMSFVPSFKAYSSIVNFLLKKSA